MYFTEITYPHKTKPVNYMQSGRTTKNKKLGQKLKMDLKIKTPDTNGTLRVSMSMKKPKPSTKRQSHATQINSIAMQAQKETSLEPAGILAVQLSVPNWDINI